jgi:Zn-dependent peptidase ImmA (M78 family)
MSLKFKPERLRNLLHFHLLTAPQLASILGLDKTVVQKYLKGLVQPSAEILKKISEEFSVQSHWFYDDLSPLKIEAFAYRSKSTTSKKERNYSESIKEIITILALKLWSLYEEKSNGKIAPLTELPDISVHPSLREVDKEDELFKQIENAAEELRTKWGLGSLPISNLTAYVESSSVWCIKRSASEKVDAFSFWVTDPRGNKRAIIVLNDKKSAVRSRFDLAHELGHLVLHRSINWSDYNNPLRRDFWKQIEKEADYFASCFLLPKNAMSTSLNSYTSLNKLLDLKVQWKTSLACLIMRGKKLKLLPQSDVLFVRMSQMQWRTNEPLDTGENAISHEYPRLFSVLCEKLKEVQAINRQFVTTLTGFDVKNFCQFLSVDSSIFAEANESPNIINLFN